MLPHDELLHYGVRGMRWGVRNEKLRSALLERSGRKIEKYDIKKERRANDQHMKSRHDQLKSDLASGKINRATYKNESQKEIQRYTRKAQELADRKSGKTQTREAVQNLRKEVNNYQRPGQNNRYNDRERYDRNSQGYQKRYQSFDKSASRTYDKPFNSYDSRRGQSTFRRAAGKIATDTATKVITTGAVKLIGPTADAFGDSLGRYVVSRPATKRFKLKMR